MYPTAPASICRSPATNAKSWLLRYSLARQSPRDGAWARSARSALPMPGERRPSATGCLTITSTRSSTEPRPGPPRHSRARNPSRSRRRSPIYRDAKQGPEEREARRAMGDDDRNLCRADLGQTWRSRDIDVGHMHRVLEPIWTYQARDGGQGAWTHRKDSWLGEGQQLPGRRESGPLARQSRSVAARSCRKCGRSRTIRRCPMPNCRPSWKSYASTTASRRVRLNLRF